jgi:hypothetical protein
MKIMLFCINGRIAGRKLKHKYFVVKYYEKKFTTRCIEIFFGIEEKLASQNMHIYC